MCVSMLLKNREKIFFESFGLQARRCLTSGEVQTIHDADAAKVVALVPSEDLREPLTKLIKLMLNWMKFVSLSWV